MKPKVGSSERSTVVSNLYLDGLRRKGEKIRITKIRNESGDITDSMEINANDYKTIL